MTMEERDGGAATEYNGWTNYATWRVNLEVFDGMDAADYFGPCADVYALSRGMREYAEALVEYQTNGEGIARDYAMAFLAQVNWDEIARHHHDEAESN